MNNFKGEYKLYKAGTSEYTEYSEGDVVSYQNSSYSALRDTKGGQRPNRNSDWQRISAADIIGVAITADAGLTGTMWTYNGFHFQDITVATGGITTAHIADNAITSTKIADGAILGVDVADGVTLTNANMTGETKMFGAVNIYGGLSAEGITANDFRIGRTNKAVMNTSGMTLSYPSDTNFDGASYFLKFSSSLYIKNGATNCAYFDSPGSGHPYISLGDISDDGNSTKFIIMDSLNRMDMLANEIHIPKDIIHASDTNTNIGFPANDEISIKIGGVTLAHGTGGILHVPVGISAQSSLIKGGTGTFVNVIAYKGISSSGNIELSHTGLGAKPNIICHEATGVSAGLGTIFGLTGAFNNVVLTQGLSAQDGLIEGYTGEFNQVVAHGGISANGMNLGYLSQNFLGLIASATAISAGIVHVDSDKVNAISIDSGWGVSAENNYIRGNTGAFTSVVLTKGLSAQDGLIEGYTGEFQQVVAVSGISCGGNVTLSSAGDIALTIKADADNSGENDNPIIQLQQDGGAVKLDVGLVGDAGQLYTNSTQNAAYLDGVTQFSDIQFATNGVARMTILSTEGDVGIGTNAPGASLDVSGSIFASDGISANASIISGNTAEFTSLVGAKGVSAAGATIGGYWAGQHEEVIGIAIDNGNDVITTGDKGQRIIPYACEVTEWTTLSNDSGSIQFDINWCTYANWPTTASVGGSGLPSISSAYKNQDTSVNWTKTTFAAGDIIEFEVDSVTTLTNCSVSLKIRRTG